jgi:hypothetical protein
MSVTIEFDDFLNEPPEYEQQRMVRDYRHDAYKKWKPVLAYIQELEASNKALTEKLAVMTDDYMRRHKDAVDAYEENISLQATIESLNLRVARLVDAHTECLSMLRHVIMMADEVPTEEWYKEQEQALTAEQDNEWLKEHDAKVLETTADCIERDMQLYAGQDCADMVRILVFELRQPKKSPETDLDQALRLR